MPAVSVLMSVHDGAPGVAQAVASVLGQTAGELDSRGALVRIVRPPLDDAALRHALIRANPFIHSSVMVRRAALERAGGYDETLPVAQDYDLWMRLARVTRLANLADVLVVRT